MDKTIQIDTFSRFTQVSRETITSLKKYENYLIESNKTLNLIGKSTINEIWLRHFLDSSQVIDFVDKNTTKNLLNKIKAKKIIFKVNKLIDLSKKKVNGLSFSSNLSNEIIISYERNKHKIEDIINIIKSEGVEIIDITTKDGNLEDVFIQLTKN